LKVGYTARFKEFAISQLANDFKGVLEGFELLDSEVEKVAIDLLKDRKLDILARMHFAKMFLAQFRSDDTKVFSRKENLHEIMNSIFSEALIEANNGLNIHLYDLLLTIDETPEDKNRMHLEPNACKTYHEHLKSNNESLIEYLIKFFRPIRASRNDTHYTIDPFFIEIFGNISNFKVLLNVTTFSDFTANRLKKIILEKEDHLFVPESTVLRPDDYDYAFVNKLYWIDN
jgi:hypothetical protein